jgi:hypothetical protein
LATSSSFPYFALKKFLVVVISEFNSALQELFDTAARLDLRNANFVDCKTKWRRLGARVAVQHTEGLLATRRSSTARISPVNAISDELGGYSVSIVPSFGAEKSVMTLN